MVARRPAKIKVFVGNRVSEILELTPPSIWRHVSSKDNPADCASRGLYPDQLATHSQWWHGPDWLQQPETQWPVSTYEPTFETDEERNPDSGCIVLRTGTQGDALPLLQRVSSYSRLTRVTAWVFRFIHNSRRQTRRDGALSTVELKTTERFWLREAQRYAFSMELDLIRKDKPLPRSSKLITFRPFIDGEGLLRVGGRMESNKLSYSKRHPVLLPRDHRVVELLINYEHLRLLHARPTLVCASLAQRFCIIRGRRTIRAKIHNCVTCRRIGARAKPQLMGQLPIARLNPRDVFENTGVDYAGPVYIKTGSVRKPIIIKAYVAVFVSFSIKAVHLEPVTELTISAFIATLRRFIARRGMPDTIWSDNGTNFVGAAKEIKKLVSDPELSNYCSHQGIRWKFTPEHAPHFGGLWEASVKSFKQHLRKIVGEVKLT